MFAQNFGAMGLRINETMCDKMGLPPFASMIKEYHILYARQELSKDKAKKAGFARAVYDQSLQHKPVTGISGTPTPTRTTP